MKITTALAFTLAFIAVASALGVRTDESVQEDGRLLARAPPGPSKPMPPSRPPPRGTFVPSAPKPKPSPNFPPGHQCGKDDQCKDGYCQNGVCKHHKASGEQCHHDSHCATGSCYQYHCASQPKTAKSGHFCNAHYQCVNGDYCHEKVSKCAPKKPDHDTCHHNSHCDSGICFSGHCLKQRSVQMNKPCGADNHCVSGGFCSRHTQKCKPAFNGKHKCSRDAACLSNKCRGGWCR